MGHKKNRNKNRVRPVCLSKPIVPASTISESETEGRGNTICYIFVINVLFAPVRVRDVPN